MIKEISLPRTESNFEQIVNLDGVKYKLRMRWNARNLHWIWRLEDLSGNVISGGRKLSGNQPLTKYITVKDMPPGELWCVVTGSTDPGLSELGGDAALMYVEEDNVA